MLEAASASSSSLVHSKAAEESAAPLSSAFLCSGEELLPSLYRFYKSVAAMLCLLGLCWITVCPANAADPARKLPPHYRHWLNEEVNYIISTDERKAFLGLASDKERDHFIENFWDLRNPDPHSEANSYREEHYRRLAYANQTFGNPMTGDGWHTDMGQIYITLGAPKQKADYQTGQNVKQMQIWFYQSETPVLPPYFYIVFYKRSPIDDYTLYSPYQDGPVRLVTTLENMNDQKKSLDIIRKSMGDEVARTTLTLLPSEPVDFSSYNPSLTSDVLLSNIRGLADNPRTLENLKERRMNEQVTTRLLVGAEQTELQTAVFRGQDRRSTVHYLLRFREPEATLIGPVGKDQMGYKLTLETTVVTAAGKPVYRDQSSLSQVLTVDQAESARHQSFAAAGRLPLVAGKYKLLVTLTNQLNHAAYRQQQDLVVPEPSGIGLELSSLVAFSSTPPVAEAEGHLPFNVSGIQFDPIGIGSATIHQGELLHVLAQVWSDVPQDTTRAARKLDFRYAYGSLSGGNTETQVEAVDEEAFDPSGSLLTGKKLATDHLAPGNYRLVVSAVEEGGDRHAYASLNFQVQPTNMPAGLWTAHDPGLSQLAGYGQDDYKRGLSASAQGNSADAAKWFSLAVNAAPPYEQGLPRLVVLLSQQQKYAELAQLGHRFAKSRMLDEKTVVLLARGIAQSGDINLATQVLEGALSWQAPTADMYSTLAGFYRASGDNAHAADLEARAKTF
jgi:GWxTD domain-containing protein